MKVYFFDDFELGEQITTPAISVTEAQIIDFAMAFDPQPMHLNREAAKGSQFGDLIASGFHSMALAMGTFFRTRCIEAANIGSPGIDQVRWLKPLKPGDTIHQVATVTELRPSRSKPDRGVVRMMHETFNQDGELIMTMDVMHLMLRRPEEA